MIIKSFTKYLLILLGSISLLLGIIGLFLPLLPTTPFLLLASFCYFRSSKRLHSWLINNKVFGKHIYNYVTYRAVNKSIKIKALLFLGGSLTISVLIIEHLYVDILLIIIGIVVGSHLLLLKTLKPDLN